MAGFGPSLTQRFEMECGLGAIPSFCFVADLLDAAESKGQPRDLLQDPVTWAYLVSTSESFRTGPDALGNHLDLPARFFELLEGMVSQPNPRRSCLEIRRFASLRGRIRDQARIAWQLAGRFPSLGRNAIWNATVFSSLGWVLLANADGAKVSSLACDHEVYCPGGTNESSQLIKKAALLARDFCLKWNLPEWCLLWTTRMSWPATVASLGGAPATEWHLVRVASFLEAQGRPTLNGVTSEGYADSCHFLGLDPRGAWREGLLRLATTVFPEKESPLGDYPEPDKRWIQIALRQSSARISDFTRLEYAHLAHERELAIRSMEAMQQDLSRLTFERVMAGMAEFTAGAGHEINNPLAIIQGRARQLHLSAKSLVKKQGLTEFRTRLEDIQEQCQRLHGLLKKLMRFARPGSPVLEAVHAQEIIERLSNICRSNFENIAFDCLSTADWNAIPAQMTHIGYLSDAWTELCRNASFAAGENGTVSMRVDLAPTGRLSIRLSNSGAAVPEEIKQNLFTPFFSSRQAGRAPGLGLPLAWRLLDSIGAKLTLESDGKDTPVCWKVEMPLMNISISTRDIPESQPVRNAA